MPSSGFPLKHGKSRRGWGVLNPVTLECDGFLFHYCLHVPASARHIGQHGKQSGPSAGVCRGVILSSHSICDPAMQKSRRQVEQVVRLCDSRKGCGQASFSGVGPIGWWFGKETFGPRAFSSSSSLSLSSSSSMPQNALATSRLGMKP